METEPTESSAPWNLATDPHVYIQLIFHDRANYPIPGSLITPMSNLVQHLTETVYQAVSQRLRDVIPTVPRPQIDDATMLADLAGQIRRYVRSSLRTSTRKHQPFGYVTARRIRRW